MVQPGQELFPLMGLSGGREHQAEPHGAASGYAHEKLGVDDTVEASAARGEFTLRPGDTPVILLSAGIGVTPVLAMLYALSGERSAREVWWLYGARNGREDPSPKKRASCSEHWAARNCFIHTARPLPKLSARRG